MGKQSLPIGAEQTLFSMRCSVLLIGILRLPILYWVIKDHPMSYDDVDACLNWRSRRFDRLMPNYVNSFKFRRFRDLFKAMDNLYEVADFTFVEDENGVCKIVISPIDVDACYAHKTFEGEEEDYDEYKEWYRRIEIGS